jgi:hypothetical protein
MRDFANNAWAYVLAFPEWSEHHSGLAGWVGAFGSIVAVFVAWGIARSEYRRAQRLAFDRLNSEIELFMRVTTEYQTLVGKYVELIAANDPTAEGYFDRVVEDDVRWLRAVDLNRLPVTQWPSVESYDAFRKYFLSAIRLLQTEPQDAVIAQRMQAYSGTFEAVQKALMAARR